MEDWERIWMDVVINAWLSLVIAQDSFSLDDVDKESLWLDDEYDWLSLVEIVTACRSLVARRACMSWRLDILSWGEGSDSAQVKAMNTKKENILSQMLKTIYIEDFVFDCLEFYTRKYI